jgi:hypothetical protein
MGAATGFPRTATILPLFGEQMIVAHWDLRPGRAELTLYFSFQYLTATLGWN